MQTEVRKVVNRVFIDFGKTTPMPACQKIQMRRIIASDWVLKPVGSTRPTQHSMRQTQTKKESSPDYLVCDRACVELHRAVQQVQLILQPAVRRQREPLHDGGGCGVLFA